MKKLVVITGASSGIGMETAKKFSANGHPTLLISRRKEIMESLNLKRFNKCKSRCYKFRRSKSRNKNG